MLYLKKVIRQLTYIANPDTILIVLWSSANVRLQMYFSNTLIEEESRDQMVYSELKLITCSMKTHTRALYYNLCL